MAIFLSYSRHDEDIVKSLRTGFEAARHTVWMDNELDGGETWWSRICSEIRSASVFVLAVSDRSLSSKACLAEWQYARELGHHVLPVQVGPADTLPSSPLAAVQVVPFRSDDAASGMRVLAAVEGAASRRRPLPDPLPDEPPIPLGYLHKIGRQIDAGQLLATDQEAVVEELRRALDGVTEQDERREIVAILNRMLTKTWLSVHVQGLINSMLDAHRERRIGPEPPPGPRPGPEDGTTRPTASSHTPDGEEILRERLEEIQRKRATPGAWPPPADGPPWAAGGTNHEDGATGCSGSGTAGSGGAMFWPGVGGGASAFTGATSAGSGSPGSGSTGASRSAGSAGTTGATTSGGSTTSGASAASEGGQGQPTEVLFGPSATGPTARLDCPAPPAYRVLSILALAGLLFGVMALYFSAQVGPLYRAHDHAGAQRASRLAKGWAVTGLVVVGVTLLIAVRIWVEAP